jgi:hypothetical protein
MIAPAPWAGIIEPHRSNRARIGAAIGRRKLFFLSFGPSRGIRPHFVQEKHRKSCRTNDVRHLSPDADVHAGAAARGKI